MLGGRDVFMHEGIMVGIVEGRGVGTDVGRLGSNGRGTDRRG